mmetsp:Transcript_38985/g.110572  ORF Transcript_38985/g.110572 Transcript_38985/m.110572 type:complete len:219 (+) Transcript_38985:318-974(+)
MRKFGRSSSNSDSSSLLTSTPHFRFHIFTSSFSSAILSWALVSFDANKSAASSASLTFLLSSFTCCFNFSISSPSSADLSPCNRPFNRRISCFSPSSSACCCASCSRNFASSFSAFSARLDAARSASPARSNSWASPSDVFDAFGGVGIFAPAASARLSASSASFLALFSASCACRNCCSNRCTFVVKFSTARCSLAMASAAFASFGSLPTCTRVSKA